MLKRKNALLYLSYFNFADFVLLHCFNSEEASDSEAECDELQEIYVLIDGIHKKVDVSETHRKIRNCWERVKKKIEKVNFQHEQRSDLYKLCKTIHELSRKLTDAGKIDVARLIISSLFELIKQFYHGQNLLEKMQHLGVSMQPIAETEADGLLDEDYELLDKVLNVMQKVRGVDVKLKCELITGFCISYGFCCIESHVYRQALEIFQKAEFMMKCVFGSDADDIELLAICYKNLGVCYHKLKETKKSNEAYRKAKNINQQASLRKKNNPGNVSAIPLKIDKDWF